jgi:hypothetical protein
VGNFVATDGESDVATDRWQRKSERPRACELGISDAVALSPLARQIGAIVEIAPSRERTDPAPTEVGDASAHALSPGR